MPALFTPALIPPHTIFCVTPLRAACCAGKDGKETFFSVTAIFTGYWVVSNHPNLLKPLITLFEYDINKPMVISRDSSM